MNERMEDEEENDGDAGETLPGEEEPEYGEEEGQDVPLKEMIPGDPGLPSAKFGGFLGDDDEKEFPGGTIRDIPSATVQPVSTSLGSKPATKASGRSLLSVAQQMKNLYNAVEKHKKDHEEKERIFRPKMAVEGCGDAEELPWVGIEGSTLTASDNTSESLASILNTAEIWQKGGIKIVGGSRDVLDALGIESPNSEALPDLMGEEPPLEE